MYLKGKKRGYKSIKDFLEEIGIEKPFRLECSEKNSFENYSWTEIFGSINHLINSSLLVAEMALVLITIYELKSLRIGAYGNVENKKNI